MEEAAKAIRESDRYRGKTSVNGRAFTQWRAVFDLTTGTGDGSKPAFFLLDQ